MKTFKILRPFTGTGAVTVYSGPYKELVLNNAGGTYKLTGATGIADNLGLTAGTLEIGSNNLTVGGSITNAGAGAVTATGSTVYLTGSFAGAKTFPACGLNNLIIS